MRRDSCVRLNVGFIRGVSEGGLLVSPQGGVLHAHFGEIRLDKVAFFSTMTGDFAIIDPGNQRIGIIAFQRWSKN